MSTTSNLKRDERVAGIEKLEAGTNLKYPNATFMLNGASYTTAQITGAMNSFVNLTADVTNAEAARTEAVKALRTQGPALLKLISAFVAYLHVTLGDDAKALAVFGLKPHKVPAPKTVKDKAKAVEQAQATRQARGTKGPKAKKAVKGVTPEPQNQGGGGGANGGGNPPPKA